MYIVIVRKWVKLVGLNIIVGRSLCVEWRENRKRWERVSELLMLC